MTRDLLTHRIRVLVPVPWVDIQKCVVQHADINVMDGRKIVQDKDREGICLFVRKVHVSDKSAQSARVIRPAVTRYKYRGSGRLVDTVRWVNDGVGDTVRERLATDDPHGLAGVVICRRPPGRIKLDPDLDRWAVLQLAKRIGLIVGEAAGGDVNCAEDRKWDSADNVREGTDGS